MNIRAKKLVSKRKKRTKDVTSLDILGINTKNTHLC